MVVPKWPTQFWYPKLKQMQVGRTFTLSRCENLLCIPSSGKTSPHLIILLIYLFAGIRTSIRVAGVPLPEKTSNIILSSWSLSMKKQYAVYIRRWTRFCAEQKLSVYQTDVLPVLQFLTPIYEQTHSYSAINTAWCALSSFIILDSGQTISTHPLISCFVRGVFNLHPPAPQYSEIWDVCLVLDYMRSLSPLSSLGLRDLTLKL